MSTALTVPFKDNVMFGLTHNEDLSLRLRFRRSLKVGIGWPRGKALRVFIHPTEKQNPWYVIEGYYQDSEKSLKERSHRFPDKESARACYERLLATAPTVNYPRKSKFFTFSNPDIDESGAEFYRPDFDAIEAHGPTPTKIPIMFLSDQPYRSGYQNWSQTELRCRGDGINASRLVSMYDAKAQVPAPHGDAWQAAQNANERWFPILDGCYTRGCPYSEKNAKGIRECKPGFTLNFQTVNHILIGETAAFHTTGWESCALLFSSLTEIQRAWERATGKSIHGLVMFLSIKPYRVHPEGQKPSTQYSVSLQLPLKAQKSIVASLKAIAAEMSDEPVGLIEAPGAAQIPPAADSEGITEAEIDVDDEIDGSPISATAMAAEFYEGDGEPAAVDPSRDSSWRAGNLTEQKSAAVAEQLAARQQTEQARQQPVAQTFPVQQTTAPVAFNPYAPQAQATATQATEPAKLWHDKQSLTTLLMAEMQRLGKPEFDKVVSRHGMISKLTFDNPKTVEFYADLKKQPTDGAQPAAAIATASGPGTPPPNAEDDF